MKNNNRVFLDVHVLQNVPPSCVNRDDTGSPKTAVYGGVTRARVSSQSWKKAMRDMFKTNVSDDLLAVRTKKVLDMISSEIAKIDPNQQSDELALRILVNAGIYKEKIEKKSSEDSENSEDAEKAETKSDDKSAALFFISYAQAKELAKLALSDPDTVSKKVGKESKNKIQNALSENPGIEIALFGRMVATDPTLNTDACAQVAHSISTHKVMNEYDYFTAVDDMQDEDNAGAGHIGTVEFNSSTLYRYATVAVHELYPHLKTDIDIAIAEFIKAFVQSMPTGKQNTFANRTLPEAVLITIRKDQPLNLAGAFETPVISADGGYVEKSAQKLVEYAQKTYADYGNAPIKSYVVGDLISALGEKLPFNNLVLEVCDVVRRECSSEEC